MSNTYDRASKATLDHRSEVAAALERLRAAKTDSEIDAALEAAHRVTGLALSELEEMRRRPVTMTVCPKCLAHYGQPIQHEIGGPWCIQV